MSVINQVLNQLEQRGAHTAADQPMVRAVQHRRRNLTMPLLAVGLALAAGIAAWQWRLPHKPVTSPTGGKAALTATAPGVPAGAVPLAPASRLSLELSMQPLPAALRQGSGQAASTGSGQALSDNNINPAANSAPDGKPRMVKQVSPPRAIPATAEIIVAQTQTDAVPMKQISSAQRADAEFRSAANSMQQGRGAEAMAGYEAALRLDAGHEPARQALVALLLEDKRNADAEKVLLEGVKIKPENTGFTMLLARLQVERGALEQAIATLEKSLSFADMQADYRAFLAALLQRQNRNEEAVSHYQIVLQHAPDNGIWLTGYGISLQALQRNAEAKDAFKRALGTEKLSPELQAFVQQRLKEL